jgi:hypothetical protein
MTPSTLHLASTLTSHAAGFTSHAAAAELICAHHTWLTRDDFVATCIRTGTSHDQHPWAFIDWEHAITALDSHQLSCSPSLSELKKIMNIPCS